MSLVQTLPRRLSRKVRFTLTYDGRLLSAGDKHTRVRNKNEIRFHFTNQLEAVASHADFSRVDTRVRLPSESKQPIVYSIRRFHGLNFIPLVARRTGASCALTIKLMRPEPPGQIVHGGDLDNRLKTLLDALRLPQNENEVLPSLAQKGSDALYTCLLEDDSLITELSVSTVLLLPSAPKNYVRLIIDIELRPFDFEV